MYDSLPICRVCLQPSLEYIDFDTPFEVEEIDNDLTYLDCFQACTRLEVEFNENCPQSLCSSCGLELKVAYEFLRKAEAADKVLRELATSTKLEKPDEEESKYCVQYNLTMEQNETASNEGTANKTEDAYGEPHVRMESQLDDDDDLEAENQSNDDDNAINMSNDAENDFDEILSKQNIVRLPENIQLQKEEQIEVDYQAPDAASKDTEVDPIQFEFQDITDEKLVDEELIVDKRRINSSQDESNPICNEWIFSNDEDLDHDTRDPKGHIVCNKCGAKFNRGLHLKTHILKFHRTLRDGWFCSLCGESFESEPKLKIHKNIDHRDKPAGLCITCGKSTNDEKALQVHVSEEHKSRKIPVECPYCKRKYQLKSLNKHVEYAHPDIVNASVNNAFTCKHCFHIAESLSALEDHVRNHLAKDEYWCADCDEYIKTKKVFDEHKSTVHHIQEVKKILLRCRECDFSTTERDIYLKHKKAHNNQNYKQKRHTYLCAQCPAKFKNPKALTDHEDYKHGDKKSAYACDMCDKKFVKNALLSYHKISAHGNDRAFKCSQCPKLFKLKRLLTMHENRHNGEKNFQCPNCDKKYLQQCHLRVHLRSHTGELPFECHLCDKKFAVRSRLTYHIAKHKGVVHKCEHCPKTYDNMTKLRFHTFKHIGCPYVCDYCQKGHPSRNRYFSHVKTKHKIVLTNDELDDNRLRNLKSFYRNTKTQVVPEPKPDPEPELELELKLEC